MKNILTILLLQGLIFQSTFSQDIEKSNDLERISLNVYMPESSEQLSEISKSQLQNKINQIVTNNGLSGGNQNGRFIVVPVISVLSKEITATTPSMTVLELQLSLYVGDGYEGIKFSSTSVTAKGVGNNETKAYNDAIKKIKVQDPSFKGFFDTGKTKILQYYTSKCDFILKEAQGLVAQEKFDEAIYKLTSVPEVCKTCFDKAMDAVIPIYKMQIDKNCKMKLSQAKLLWASNQDITTANNVSEILSEINPNASCYKEVSALVSEISKRVKQLDQREWKFKLKQQQDDIDIRKATIRAARDIGVAYGNHQPNIVYNIRGWW